MEGRVSGGVFPCGRRTAGRAGLQARGEGALSLQITVRLKVNAGPSLRGRLFGTCELGCQ